jgi:hypothetical protein
VSEGLKVIGETVDSNMPYTVRGKHVEPMNGISQSDEVKG